MLNTYEAILHDNQLEWSGDAPPQLQSNHTVRVRVTILDAPPSSMGISQGQTMAAALERLAAKNGSSQLPDGAAWERQIRQDRPLPRHET